MKKLFLSATATLFASTVFAATSVTPPASVTPTLPASSVSVATHADAKKASSPKEVKQRKEDKVGKAVAATKQPKILHPGKATSTDQKTHATAGSVTKVTSASSVKAQ